MPAFRYRLGDEVHDLTTRTLVMGILNRTPDSFYDHGATFELDSLLRRADVLVAQGADLLDVGGVKAGPGPEVGEAEELDRVVAPIAALHERFDVAISCDTWRAAGARRGLQGRRGGRQRHQRLRRSRLPRRRRHPRRVGRRHPHPAAAPRRPIRNRTTTTWSATSPRSCSIARRRAEAAGLAPEQIALDAGLDLGKTPSQSAVLLRESDALAALGYTLLLSSSNKRFLGELLELDIDARRAASLAAVAYGVAHGCRIVRVHDVEGSVAVCRMVEAILAS